MNSILIRYFNFSFIFMALILLSSCNWFKSKDSIQVAKKTGLILINVNDEESFKDARIKNSLNIPYEKIEQDPTLLSSTLNKWDKNSTIVVYCIDYACSASHIIAKKIKNLGFNQVYVYSGGIQEWYQLAQQDKNAYPYEGDALAQYLRRPINKINNQDETIKTISALDLSKRLEEVKT